MEQLFDSLGRPVATILEGADLQALVGPPPDIALIEAEADCVLAESPASGDPHGTWLE